MKNFIANINCRIDDYSNCAVTRVIYENCKDKKEVINKLILDYPEYFINGKVCQKITNKAKEQGEFIYVTIFELDEQWEKYWCEAVKCEVCGKESKRIDIFNYAVSGGGFWNKSKFCSKECQEKYDNATRFEGDDIGYHEKNGQHIYIYKITHKLTGRCYIGKTINHFVFRWWSHLKADTGTKFHEAIRKSHHTDWTFEVLEVLPTETLDSDVFKIESKYIVQFDSINNGYNSILSNKEMNQ